MSGEMEAAGAMATAGLVAGAIEGREPEIAGEGCCTNCGATINGRFCAQCGQATFAHRSLVHMAQEFLHGIFQIDTKLWRTLPMVIFRPGTLTRNYVYGKRARYISPLALFLFTMFLMFFAVSFIDAPAAIDGTPAEQRAEMVSDLTEARADLVEAQRDLAEEEAKPPPTDGTPVGLEVRLARQAVTLAEAEVARREASLRRLDEAEARRAAEAAAANAPAAAVATDGAAPVETPAADAPAAEAPAPVVPPAPPTSETPGRIRVGVASSGDDSRNISWEAGETWQDGMRHAAEREDFEVFGGNTALNERVRQNFRNPDLAIFKVQEAASKFSFILAPLSLPFICLLFLWKRGLSLYDHVVYALYALSFAAILFVLMILTAQSPYTNWLPGILFLALPVHTFFHLGGAYGLGWWSALWRTFFMLIFALIIGCLFVVFIFILGFTG